MEKNEEIDKIWVLNTALENLTVNERKDAIVLLYFLNEYQEQSRAFKQLKSIWINSIYKLPKTSSKDYNTVKNGRYNIHSGMKRIYEEFVVKLNP
jgi:hypothetical protein